MNELHAGLCQAPTQVVGRSQFDQVGAGREGCCTSLMYLHGLALEDGEVAGLGYPRLAALGVAAKIYSDDNALVVFPPACSTYKQT